MQVEKLMKLCNWLHDKISENKVPTPVTAVAIALSMVSSYHLKTLKEDLSFQLGYCYQIPMVISKTFIVHAILNFLNALQYGSLLII